MVNIKNIESKAIVLDDARYRGDDVYLASALTYAAGTILARTTAAGAGQNKLVPFVKGGPNGTGIPVRILTEEVVSTTESTVNMRVLVSGVLDRGNLVIDADGDATNIDEATVDILKQNSLIALDVDQLSAQANQ